MKRHIKSGFMAAVLSLMLTVPAYAHTTTEDGGNGGMGNGMGTVGTKAYDGSRYRINEVGTTSNYDVSVYGTGTGSQYWNTNNQMIDTGRIQTNNYTGYGMNTLNGNTDNRLRAASTPTDRGGWNWGWLGLLGLIGLAGMWGRNPGRERR
ncbi:WGxxGxxG family protein [Paenibacillus sp. VCA1]|uniref:WGxxGxxG family protein n=1 Tax=Paenibacillus sp. VCA1 TaxID=3039148 RepID=UPI0028724403|nr:WGxxGxxG family protein [Paenibacillus sp. VCA1]MDR9854286.1 WGxxGxxG family protein [Paenibacillus sp. VCA1]